MILVLRLLLLYHRTPLCHDVRDILYVLGFNLARYVVVVRAEYISNVRAWRVPEFSLLTYVYAGYYGILSISNEVTFFLRHFEKFGSLEKKKSQPYHSTFFSEREFDLLKMGRVRVYIRGDMVRMHGHGIVARDSKGQ